MKPAEIHLGDISLDLASARLTGPDGREITLRHKSKEVLLALAGHPGETVTKDTLTELVWPDTTVSDEGLVQCIADIRRALGDEDKTIIETIPREGYRLHTTPEPKASRRVLPVALAALALLAVTAFLFWASQTRQSIPEIPVLAVLPLDDLSNGDHKGYLDDALSEGIITELARYPQFKVIARHSSFQFRGTPSDIREIGKTLGANYVVEGSQQYDGENLRVTIQLIDAKSGTHVFSDRIDGKIEDLFQVQDRIVWHVASTVGGKILNRMPTNRSAGELDSILRSMKARSLMSHYSRENWAEALALEQTSVQLDPDSPWGYIGTSMMLSHGAGERWIDGPADQILQQAAALADKALMLDPENYMSHYAKARVLETQNLYTDALRHFERAAELNPSDSLVLIGMSGPLIYLNEPDRAIEVLQQAQSVDPLNGDWLLWQLAAAWWLKNDCDKGVDAMLSMARPPPTSWKMLSALHACAGDEVNAHLAMEKFLDNAPDYTIATERRVNQPWTAEGATERWLDDLRLAGMPEGQASPDPAQ